MKKHLLMTIIMIMAVIPCFAAETYNLGYDKSIDLTNSRVSVESDGYKIKADITRPAEPFKPIEFTFFVTKNGKPVTVQNGYIQMNMTMDMGLYKYDLVKSGWGYSAKATLPKCIFGGKRWFVKLVFFTGAQEHTKMFIFDMKD